MAIVWDSGSGQLCVEVRGREVVVVTYKGAIDRGVISCQDDACEAALARTSPARIFVDAEAVTTYTSDARVAGSTFWKRNLHRVTEIHILIDRHQRIVAMAAEVVNLALGGVVTVDKNRDTFEDAIARAEGNSGSRIRAGRAVA